MNIFYFKSLAIGDWTYWDAEARNPSQLARDLWLMPSGNDAIAMAATDLAGDKAEELFILKKEKAGDVNLYLYNSLVPGDWTYWDAHARNPSQVARDLWVLPTGNDAVGMGTLDIDADGNDEIAILKKEGVGDTNLYVYNSLVPGDWVYWDAYSRNPTPLARDLWVIPVGNDAIGMTTMDINNDSRKELAMLKKEGAGDVNLYFYNLPRPGDWTYWDAIARNPSPLARDLWLLPTGNDAVGIIAIDMNLDGTDELGILKQEGVGDLNLYFYNSLVPGDWTYWDAFARNPTPLARDLWLIPIGNTAAGIGAVRTK